MILIFQNIIDIGKRSCFYLHNIETIETHFREEKKCFFFDLFKMFAYLFLKKNKHLRPSF